MQNCEEIEKEVSFRKPWIEIGSDLVVSFFGAMQRYGENVLERQKERIIQSILVGALLFLSAIFLLNGLSLLINDLFQLRNWGGYGIVGLGLLIAFFFMQQRSHAK